MKQSQREEFPAGASPGPGIVGQPDMMQALNNLKSMRKKPENWRRSTSAKG